MTFLTLYLTNCKYLNLLRRVIFDILGTPDDLSFITDEKAQNYVKSFGKIDKTPFKKLYDFIPPDIEDFL